MYDTPIEQRVLLNNSGVSLQASNKGLAIHRPPLLATLARRARMLVYRVSRKCFKRKVLFFFQNLSKAKSSFSSVKVQSFEC